MERAFQMRLRDYNKVAKRKAKQGMYMITQQCQNLFKGEWYEILKQYNAMRDSLFKAQSHLLLSQCQKHYIEKEHSAAQRMYNIDPEKSMGFVEDFVYDPKVPRVTEESMNEANAVLDAPF